MFLEGQGEEQEDREKKGDSSLEKRGKGDVWLSPSSFVLNSGLRRQEVHNER